MSIINTRDKTICAKVVYYGAGLGGKTTSLKVVHGVLDPDQRVKLVTLKTDEERTLFFDFLPLDLGVLSGYRLRIQGFTVPGQVKYDLTRRYVLMGADAVVFVADSQGERLADNVESLNNLATNLAANGLDADAIPLVIQYNKRDLPNAAPVEILRAQLNLRGVPDFCTAATSGAQVFDAFAEVSRIMVDQIGRRYGLEVGADGLSALLARASASRPYGPG